jgi:hypothetical protein
VDRGKLVSIRTCGEAAQPSTLIACDKDDPYARRSSNHCEDGNATREGQEKNVPSSYQLRQQEQHEKKLQDMRDQVASGTLVIRQMTREERKRFPPRAAEQPAARSKRR